MTAALNTLSLKRGDGTDFTQRVWDESGTGAGPFAPVFPDSGPAWNSIWGVSSVPFTSADAHSAVASVSDAPTSGQKLCIDDLIISVDTTMSVTFKEETSGTVIAGPFYLSANSGPVQVTVRGKLKLATANKKLQVITSVAGNISVLAGYHSEA